MARVTVEDCIEIVPNRFELVAIASKRAKDITAGSKVTVDRDNDKDAVIALREIADQTIEPNELRETLIQNSQQLLKTDTVVEGDVETAEEQEDSSYIEEEIESLTVNDEGDEDISFAEDNIDTDD